MIAQIPDKRILFVDDDPRALQAIRRMMHISRKRWHIECAPGGTEALQIAEELPIDLIVADMQMPGMNGAELLVHFLHRFPRTIRFALSGYTDRALVLQAAGVSHQFFAKPCDSDYLKNAIASVFHFRDLIGDKKAQALISSVESLPILPTTYQAINDAFSSSECNIQQIVPLIRGDIGLAAKVLHLGHWGFFGHVHRIRPMENAAGLLGLQLLKRIFLSTSMFHQFPPETVTRFRLPELNRHSLFVSRLAEKICRILTPDEYLARAAGTAGLVHDIGKLILMTHWRDEYEVLEEEHCETGIPLHQLEKKMFGVSHAEIGGGLLMLWGLPRESANVVTFHHEPNRALCAALPPLAAVHAADKIWHTLRAQGNADDHDLENCLRNGGLRRFLPEQLVPTICAITKDDD